MKFETLFDPLDLYEITIVWDQRVPFSVRDRAREEFDAWMAKMWDRALGRTMVSNSAAITKIIAMAKVISETAD